MFEIGNTGGNQGRMITDRERRHVCRWPQAGIGWNERGDGHSRTRTAADAVSYVPALFALRASRWPHLRARSRGRPPRRPAAKPGVESKANRASVSGQAHRQWCASLAAVLPIGRVHVEGPKDRRSEIGEGSPGPLDAVEGELGGLAGAPWRARHAARRRRRGLRSMRRFPREWSCGACFYQGGAHSPPRQRAGLRLFALQRTP